MEKNKGGRPTKLDERTQEKIISAIKAGNYIETAAAYAGISKNTLYEWLKRGEREKQRVEKSNKAKIKKSEEIYVIFTDAVEKALAEAEMRDVLIIGKAAEKEWQAAAWRLERKFPDRWGKRVIEMSHDGKIELTLPKIVEVAIDDGDSED